MFFERMLLHRTKTHWKQIVAWEASRMGLEVAENPVVYIIPKMRSWESESFFVHRRVNSSELSACVINTSARSSRSFHSRQPSQDRSIIQHRKVMAPFSPVQGPEPFHLAGSILWHFYQWRATISSIHARVSSRTWAQFASREPSFHDEEVPGSYRRCRSKTGRDEGDCFPGNSVIFDACDPRGFPSEYYTRENRNYFRTDTCVD